MTLSYVFLLSGKIIMSILILNSFRGKNIPYPAWIGNPDEKLFILSSEHQNNFDGYYYGKSFIEYEKNTDVIEEAISLIKQHQIKTIIAKSECDLLRVAKLRDDFDIEGQRYDQALAFRDKVVMKSYLEKNHIRVPVHQRIQNKNDAIIFSQRQGFPLVLKPTDGAGSLNTVILKNKEELLGLEDAFFTHNMEIEEYIFGDMYHVDGIVLNGKVEFIYPSKYFYDCLRYQNNESSGSCILDYDHPLRERLVLFVKSILAALPTPAITTFHAEVFHTPNDELVFCEIASRTGGVRIREMISHAFDIDLDKIWIQAQAGVLDSAQIKWLDKPKKITGWVLIPPKQGVLKKFPDTELPCGIVEYQKNGKLNHAYSKPEKSSDCVASFVAAGDCENKVIACLKESEKWFSNHAVWG